MAVEAVSLFNARQLNAFQKKASFLWAPTLVANKGGTKLKWLKWVW
jgi:hypothetical protein